MAPSDLGERELLAAHERFAAAFNRAPVGMLVSRITEDREAVVVRCNPAFAELVGFTVEELVGQTSPMLLHPDDLPERERLFAAAAAGEPERGEIRVRHRDGHWIWTLFAPAVIQHPDGETEVIVQALDITERKRFEERLRHLADHDALTGLVSRRRFGDELAREVARVRRSGGRSCLLLLDLDGFKYVNDAFGHSAGDELLVRLTSALSALMREADLIGRIGGDEFAVLLSDTDVDAARTVAERVVQTVRAHGRVTRDATATEVTASVGVTLIGGSASLDAEQLLVEADIAMYPAKDAGKDRVVVYDRTSRHREHLARRADWVGRLRAAIRTEDFVLHAQPIVALDGGDATADHHEVLLRLRDGERLVPPASFLAHAEREGLVADIDRWVLRQVVGRLGDAHRAGRPLRLAVNFSAVTLQEPGIADHLAGLLAEHPIAPGALTVEITETAAITNVARAAELARRLRGLGCRLALDDFGAGFASFAYLKHLVFDVLKIDGEFIERLPSSPTDQLIVRAVVDVARGLGAEVVAERVTGEATVAELRALGIRLGQGWFLGRPRPLDELS